jgi:hypothetical protein
MSRVYVNIRRLNLADRTVNTFLLHFAVLPDCTMSSESRCALRLWYIRTYVRFGRVQYVRSRSPPTPLISADLQKLVANKIKQFQACIEARGHHFQHLL